MTDEKIAPKSPVLTYFVRTDEKSYLKALKQGYRCFVSVHYHNEDEHEHSLSILKPSGLTPGDHVDYFVRVVDKKFLKDEVKIRAKKSVLVLDEGQYQRLVKAWIEQKLTVIKR